MPSSAFTWAEHVTLVIPAVLTVIVSVTVDCSAESGHRRRFHIFIDRLSRPEGAGLRIEESQDAGFGCVIRRLGPSRRRLRGSTNRSTTPSQFSYLLLVVLTFFETQGQRNGYGYGKGEFLIAQSRH